MKRAFAFLVAFFFRIAIWLRYRITIKGLEQLLQSGERKGIIFLPNHPALIDPLILNSILWSRFHPRALADEKYIKNSALKCCWRALRLLPIPDLGVAGMTGHDAVVAQLGRCVEALKAGDNLLIYPAGRIYHSKTEKLRGNGGVSRILQEYPEAKVVLVRTTGLWGSDFSRSKGYHPDFGQVVRRHFKHLLLAFLFFMPRRHVTIEFVPRPDDFPATADKEVLNRYLENFYNVAMRPNTYVPYTWFEAHGPRVLPEPDLGSVNEDTSRVPAEVREKVLAKLRELTGKSDIRDTDTLGTDLGLDSLIIAELQYWIATEFGHEVPSPEKLRTAASLMLAAIGEASGVEPLYPVPPNWFFEDASPLGVTEAKTIPHAFLINARRFPGRPVWADQLKGVFTNRKMVLAVMALRPS
ncbi:MAG: 1-acyl-sn-glycerol-3-phosphate acyltransferase, partial [Victivallales bacterium]|nr:1-acyl-sn-glycerol-3-phosphate acyltransferase [Victivallales bacterium]